MIKRLAHYCDALQFGTPELKRKYGYLNPRCCVFPNQILAAPPERTQKPDGTVIVGWGGSISHLPDMAKISDRLVRWIMNRDDVHLYLMCADEISELFKALPDDRKRRFATGSIEDYYSFLSHLDIGIAPLEDTPFNRSRSDIKVLEYAANGVVPVVQATGPYLLSVKQGRTGFFFNTPDELISTLDHLVSDAAARARVSASAREYVLRERNCIDHGKDRVEFYRSLFAAKPGTAISRPGAGRRNARIIAAADGGCKPSGANCKHVRPSVQLRGSQEERPASSSEPDSLRTSFAGRRACIPSVKPGEGLEQVSGSYRDGAFAIRAVPARSFRFPTTRSGR